MRKNIILAYMAAAAMLSAVSCIKDLDALPLNPTDYTAEAVYGTEEGNYLSGLAKIYHTLYMTDGVSNVGTTAHAQFIMAYWALGEITTDAAKCAWKSDTWAHYMNNNTWTTVSLDPTLGIYCHSLLGATYVNEFLKQTTDEKLGARGVDESLKQKIHGMRAEARFIRAFEYWTMVDVFGKTPFVDENFPIGKEAPPVKTRKEAFDWLVDELKELESSPDMPEAGSNYPRVDKGCATALLIRLYLNAEVYTGTAMWQETKDACERLFEYGYDLCPEYAWLFRGDNGENPLALQEIIMGNYQDLEHTAWNWGGTTYLIASEINGNVNTPGFYPIGCPDSWNGFRMDGQFVEKFFHPTDVDFETGTYNIEDKRGKDLFYIKGRSNTIENLWKFEQGWGVHKWSNLPHDMSPEEYKPKGWMFFADTDYIFMRLGEMYLAYAEACLNLGQKSSAIPYLNKLRIRAGVSEISDYDANFIFEESSRELYWEGNRRRDLIRWNMFSSSKYNWHWKGGNFDGQSFPEYMEIFPFPVTELQNNPNLAPQNPGYDK